MVDSCSGPRGGRTVSHDTSAALPLRIQTAIAVFLSTVKAGYRFDILRNESASTDKSSEHYGPCLPSLSECLLLTFVFEFELCMLRAPQGPAPVQATKKSGTKMPLRLQKAIFVCRNYIPHTFNPLW